MYSEISNFMHHIPMKSKISISNATNRFGIEGWSLLLENYYFLMA